ncbi:2-amino-4-hydroxy-6-hydroxymethyldihydropteridine diphosphokinase [Pokkaliibacter plantistimulans]|uniref:2-amino-4-hydroxy-6-hydroxymethyldihydropteridine diphosphokinase n=1 Tax=Proteobacteria bacterium 228 TaxID=2083153 RepID=A0A2S5KIF7_9PROT|nr:2-amino-4-hydroxy-6-hydroxymethyldihydropteridine diphosphokinase [Pokkaliibacter plantistimulans]PPC74604.1 2-amino-4-hydroxy-6-hydroxymethyldihydropteridine diphosphokinase [Pokkaliibacter plantistimulans]
MALISVFVSLGSNQQREFHLAQGLDELQQHFGDLLLSSVYESPAVGFNGPAFFNMVVGFTTELPLDALAARLRDIELHHGRPSDAVKFSSRTLDIDILTYADWHGRFATLSLPRKDLLSYAHMLLPMAEVAGAMLHPGGADDYQTCWRQFSDTAQRIWTVDYQWQGRVISQQGSIIWPEAAAMVLPAELPGELWQPLTSND